MTIADHVREEVMSKYARNLAKKGLDVSFFADVTELPLKKVQDIIQKIKDSSN